MKIDESVIAKVLDNKASPEEARKVAGWFATEEGNKYLSERFDWEIGMLSEEMPESIDPHSIPEVKMKVRFMNEIKCERGQRPVGRRWMWVAAVLLPFVFLSVSLFFLANRTGIFSEPEYADINVPYGEQIEHKMLSNAIEKAQEKIEGNNFGIRKNLLEYDQVMNDQREIIYGERRRVLDGENMRNAIYKMITDRVENTVDRCVSDEEDKNWDVVELNELLIPVIPMQPLADDEIQSLNANELKHMLKERAVKLYEAKEAEFPEAEMIRELERVVLLKTIDRKWMDHIDDMEILREGIGLQAYGQRDPLVEYKMAGFEMFDDMTASIQEETIQMLFHVKVEQKVEREEVAKVTGTNKDDSTQRAPKTREAKKVYPNDPCPCGSGKKYKQCCGRKA